MLMNYPLQEPAEVTPVAEMSPEEEWAFKAKKTRSPGHVS